MAGPTYPESYTMPKTAEKFVVGDCVLLDGKGKQDYIGKIIEFEVKNRKTVVKVQRYYFPKETHYMRRSYIGSKEVFESKETLSTPANTILKKCTIHSLKRFYDLEEYENKDYYCRFQYIPNEDVVRPVGWDDDCKWVKVYCICEQSPNLDQNYVHCEECKDWLHPECIGHTFEDVKDEEFFVCDNCRKKNREEPNK